MAAYLAPCGWAGGPGHFTRLHKTTLQQTVAPAALQATTLSMA